MAGFVLIVVVDVLALLTVPTAGGIFHLLPSSSSSSSSSSGGAGFYNTPPPQQQQKQPMLPIKLPLGLHSFTNGRGNYKNMAHEFLVAHNRVRANYGVPPLRWSNKLAKYARRWSAARRFDCVLMHSGNGNPPYGENVFMGSGWDWRAVDAVSSWASEAAFYDWGAQQCQPNRVCGHFTQLVWNDTELVGCGRSECLAGSVYITCSYDPGGNWLGEAPLS